MPEIDQPGQAEDLDAGGLKVYVALAAAAALSSFSWLAWIVISTARLRDIIHDRLAKTTVFLT